MIVQTYIEALLRASKFDTKASYLMEMPVICFEDDVVIGFVFVFENGEILLSKWQDVQQQILTSYADELREAGDKSWNIYSIFMAEGESSSDVARKVERLEEDFTFTRKIARANIHNSAQVNQALLPLMRIRSRPSIESVVYKDKLSARLSDVPPNVVTAFLEGSDTSEIARILVDSL